jgi:hypothetical protein
MGARSTTLKAKLPNGAIVHVEATSLGRELDGDVASIDAIEEVLPTDVIENVVEGIATLVHSSIERLKPTKAKAEFGLQLGIESGKLTALWVKGTATANVTISLEWGGRSTESSAQKVV